MTDQPDNSLRVSALTADDLSDIGAPLSLPSYEIATDDQPIADAIMAMDVLKDVAGPCQLTGQIAAPNLTLATLPPALREGVERQLAMVPASRRAESEREFVRKALEENQFSVRTIMGVAADSLPIHKEQAEIAGQVRTLYREFDAITDQLCEIARYDAQFNPETGLSEPVSVLRYQGDARKALEARRDAALRNAKLLDGGIEGQRRLAKARYDSVEVVKARKQAVADQAEVDKRAAEIAREARINKLARAKARHLGAEVD